MLLLQPLNCRHFIYRLQMHRLLFRKWKAKWVFRNDENLWCWITDWRGPFFTYWRISCWEGYGTHIGCHSLQISTSLGSPYPSLGCHEYHWSSYWTSEGVSSHTLLIKVNSVSYNFISTMGPLLLFLSDMGCFLLPKLNIAIPRDPKY